MQGRARGRKGERKTLPYVAKPPHASRASKGEAQGVLSYQNLKGIFAKPPSILRQFVVVKISGCKNY